MALTKAIEMDDGAEVSYWNIGAVQEDFKGQGVTITVYGYKTQSARDAGKQPAAARVYTIVGDEYIADFSRADAYVKVKQQAEFEGATDC